MAFSEKSEKLVKELIQAEYNNACKVHGDKYHSLHEGYAVLLEEVEEVKIEVDKLSANLDMLWRKIKSNDTDIESLVRFMRNTPWDIILESAQVGAVLMKIKNTIGEVEE